MAEREAKDLAERLAALEAMLQLAKSGEEAALVKVKQGEAMVKEEEQKLRVEKDTAKEAAAKAELVKEEISKALGAARANAEKAKKELVEAVEALSDCKVEKAKAEMERSGAEMRL